MLVGAGRRRVWAADKREVGSSTLPRPIPRTACPAGHCLAGLPLAINPTAWHLEPHASARDVHTIPSTSFRNRGLLRSASKVGRSGAIRARGRTDPEQRLELVQRLLRLADQDVDPHELQLDVGAEVAIPADRHQLHAPPPFPHRVRLPPQIRQGQSEQHVALPVVGRGPTLLLEREPRRVGIERRPGAIAAVRDTAGSARCPSSPGRRRTRSAATRAPAAAARRPAPSRDPGRPRGSGTASRDRSVAPPRGSPPGRCRDRPARERPAPSARRIAGAVGASATARSAAESAAAGTARDVCTVASRRAVLAERGIQQRGAREPRGRLVPAAQIRLGHRERTEQVDVVGREPESLLVLRQRRARCRSD